MKMKTVRRIIFWGLGFNNSRSKSSERLSQLYVNTVINSSRQQAHILHY